MKRELYEVNAGVYIEMYAQKKISQKTFLKWCKELYARYKKSG